MDQGYVTEVTRSSYDVVAKCRKQELRQSDDWKRWRKSSRRRRRRRRRRWKTYVNKEAKKEREEKDRE